MSFTLATVKVKTMVDFTRGHSDSPFTYQRLLNCSQSLNLTLAGHGLPPCGFCLPRLNFICWEPYEICHSLSHMHQNCISANSVQKRHAKAVLLAQGLGWHAAAYFLGLIATLQVLEPFGCSWPNSLTLWKLHSLRKRGTTQTCHFLQWLKKVKVVDAPHLPPQWLGISGATFIPSQDAAEAWDLHPRNTHFQLQLEFCLGTAANTWKSHT